MDGAGGASEAVPRTSSAGESRSGSIAAPSAGRSNGAGSPLLTNISSDTSVPPVTNVATAKSPAISPPTGHLMAENASMQSATHSKKSTSAGPAVAISPLPVPTLAPFTAATAVPKITGESPEPPASSVAATSIPLPAIGALVVPHSASEQPVSSPAHQVTVSVSASNDSTPQTGHLPSTSSHLHRANPMSMSNLLSSSEPPTTSASPISRVAAMPAAGATVTSAPLGSIAHDRSHDGPLWAPHKSRQPDSGYTPIRADQDRSGRFEYPAFERRRQASEGSSLQGAHIQHQGDTLRHPSSGEQHRRNTSYDFHSGTQAQQSTPRHLVAATTASTSGTSYPAYASGNRQDSFLPSQRQGSDSLHSHYHHHHHHHSASQPQMQSKRSNDITSLPPTATGAGQNAWNKAFAPSPWQPGASARNSDEKVSAQQQSHSLPPGTQNVQTHKRKRSEWSEPSIVSSSSNVLATDQQLISQAPPTPMSKRPPGPLFTVDDLDRIMYKPKFVKISSDKVTQAIPDVQEPRILETLVWDPAVDTSRLLDGRILSQNIGHEIKVIIHGKWMQGAGKVVVGDPQSTTAISVASTEGTEEKVTPIAVQRHVAMRQTAWTVWDLDPIRRRQLWGTDVYTDDSDVLAMCLHSGWIRCSASMPSNIVQAVTSKDEVPRSLEVTLSILPRLLRYQSTSRGGLRSRSWGNRHDGVSLRIQRVEASEASPMKRIRQISREKRTAARNDAPKVAHTFGFSGAEICLRIDTRGEAYALYSAELAARLARALVYTDNMDRNAGDDVEMKDATMDGEAVAQDAGHIFMLSMKGHVIWLCEGSKRHKLTATDASSYSLDEMSDISAVNLEFSDDGVVVRADDYTERARFPVDRLTWRSPEEDVAV